MSAAATTTRAWARALGALALLWAALLWTGREAAGAMLHVWLNSGTFAHALTVPPIALWLAWRRRAVLAALPPRAAPWLLLPLAALVLAWLLGELAVTNAVPQLALVASLALAVPAVLGLRVGRVLLFPLGFLFFAVPLGEFLMPQLMAWTADFTVFALRASGIPVARDGLQFVIPSGNWSVEAACSGIRYLIASLMVGVLFAYLNYQSLRRRLLFVAMSGVVPIVANWVRAYLIVLLGHLSDNTIATGVDHLIYGWLFFGLVIMVLFAVSLRWAEPEPPAAPSPAAPAPLQGAARALAACWGVALAGAVLALAAQGWLAQLRAGHGGAQPPSLQALLAPAAGWQLTDAPAAEWQHGFRNAPAQFEARYERGAQRVGLAVAYYAGQRRDRTLVSSENRLVPEEDHRRWQVGASSERQVKLSDTVVTIRSTALRAMFTPTQAPAQRLAVFQLYWVDGAITTSDEWAKLRGAWGQLRGHGDDGAVILAYAAQPEGGDAAAVLEDFLRDHLAALLQQLQRVREVRRSTIDNGSV